MARGITISSSGALGADSGRNTTVNASLASGQQMSSTMDGAISGSGDMASASASLGTAWGNEQTFNTVSTHFNKAGSNPNWIAVINYDTIQGLRKRGVPVDDTRKAEAKAFPGHNPDGCYIPKR
jgi:hypothetical protein